jgi:tetratricopeptide (TPR) repeat protein
VAAVLLPLLCLGALELGLRLAGYGYPTGFFKSLRIGGQEYLVENDSFGSRFFPPNLARMPDAFRMPAQKAPGTYRIFILGESAALGDPEPAFGAGRYLAVLLHERFPQVHFEVVNAAMTAIDSHVILPIARDCAGQSGDCWIIYMGNNEMVGPDGAATVFGSRATPWPLVRLNLALQQLRLGQWLAAAGRKLSGAGAQPAGWQGMAMFTKNSLPPDDPRKEVVYRNFERNLRDILRVGLATGTRIVLSTVAVNFKDCPPFGSVNPGGDFDHLLNAGNALAEQGHAAAAVPFYLQAGQLNPHSAELEYRWGTCLLQITSQADAREHFQKAVDLDTLPFRADSRINEVITNVAARMACPQLALFDAPAALRADDPQGIPGQKDFYEHVHLNFDGNYRLARGWAEQVARLLPSTLAGHAAAHWADQSVCEQRLGLSLWDRVNVVDEVGQRLQQPPLSTQWNNAARLRFYAGQAARLHESQDAANAQIARHTYLDALQRAPEDTYLLENYAGFLADQGDYPAAAAQWLTVRALMPQDQTAYFELGHLAGLQHDYAGAKVWLNQALDIHPNFAPGWFELGRVQAAAGNYELAVAAFDQGLRFEPQNAQAWFDSGLALAMLNRPVEAIEHYRQSVTFGPDNWKAHFELGGLLGQTGQMAEACTESAAAVRLNPDFPIAHLNLGMALVQLGKLDDAVGQFEATLRLDPTNAKAADYLAQTQALQRNRH